MDAISKLDWYKFMFPSWFKNSTYEAEYTLYEIEYTSYEDRKQDRQYESDEEEWVD